MLQTQTYVSELLVVTFLYVVLLLAYGTQRRGFLLSSLYGVYAHLMSPHAVLLESQKSGISYKAHFLYYFLLLGQVYVDYDS